jgi:hypothetical protein
MYWCLSPLFFFRQGNENGRIRRWIKSLFSNPAGMLFISECFGSYELIRRVRILRPLFGLALRMSSRPIIMKRWVVPGKIIESSPYRFENPPVEITGVMGMKDYIDYISL